MTHIQFRLEGCALKIIPKLLRCAVNSLEWLPSHFDGYQRCRGKNSFKFRRCFIERISLCAYVVFEPLGDPNIEVGVPKYQHVKLDIRLIRHGDWLAHFATLADNLLL